MAEALGCVFDEIFPSSTGIIGVPLPVEKLIAAVPAAKAGLGETVETRDSVRYRDPDDRYTDEDRAGDD